MNYLAHAWVLPDEARTPDLVLGCALPDLLGAFDRRAPRLGPEAPTLLASVGERELARGVRAHHAADACFHELDVFRALARELGAVAARMGRVRGFFLGHVLLEVLLDAVLDARDPSFADSYYRALEAVDVASRSAAASRAAGTPRDAPAFERFHARFLEARFLLDYRTDEGLARRIRAVLARARQDPGEEGTANLVAALPRLRERVRDHAAVLTEPPRRAVLASLEG